MDEERGGWVEGSTFIDARPTVPQRSSSYVSTDGCATHALGGSGPSYYSVAFGPGVGGWVGGEEEGLVLVSSVYVFFLFLFFLLLLLPFLLVFGTH